MSIEITETNLNTVKDSPTAIGGRYVHYKNQDHKYDVFCAVYDGNGNKYVLYQQLYDKREFWIRPYDMFFELVDYNQKQVKRFAPTESKRKDTKTRIHDLLELFREEQIIAMHSESIDLYCIINIDENNNFVEVSPLQGFYQSGYLSEYELLDRLGYYGCVINGKKEFFKNKTEVNKNFKLKIGNNDANYLKEHLNPCSIDLQIASQGFLVTKRKLVDPSAIEYISSAKELWKAVKTYRSKNTSNTYFKLRPNQMILTHIKDQITIPCDCAGKIEIKSTFARLSLSVTSGDFCNPGYSGYFPLEIKNNGKHTIIIHAGDTMAQLMLIPLCGPIIEKYTNKSTYINHKGYDDGTPYSFWMERSIKALRNKEGAQPIVSLYYAILNEMQSNNINDINDLRDRFNNTFLPYCQKNSSKKRYIDNQTNLPDANKLAKAYAKREKRLKKIFDLKLFSLLIVPCILSLLAITSNYMSKETTSIKGIIPYAIAILLFICIGIFLYLNDPHAFCTFENIDIDNLTKPQ